MSSRTRVARGIRASANFSISFDASRPVYRQPFRCGPKRALPQPTSSRALPRPGTAPTGRPTQAAICSRSVSSSGRPQRSSICFATPFLSHRLIDTLLVPPAPTAWMVRQALAPEHAQRGLYHLLVVMQSLQLLSDFSTVVLGLSPVAAQSFKGQLRLLNQPPQRLRHDSGVRSTAGATHRPPPAQPPPARPARLQQLPPSAASRPPSRRR